MAKERQTLASIERDYRQGPPWFLVLFAAMFALLAMFLILNAQAAQSRDARVDALGIQQSDFQSGSGNFSSFR
jgi:hypothetical protein